MTGDEDNDCPYALTATPLADRVAVVTGGGAGIGGGISRLFAVAGATVILNDIDSDLAARAVEDIHGRGGSAVAVVGDIRDDSTIDALVAAVEESDRGRPDVLVNNVGDFRPGAGRFVRTTDEDWDAQYEITLRHVHRVTRRFLPAMIEGGGGSIVNNATVEALRGIPRLSAYSAFNAGVIAFTRALAVEVGGAGVRVNCIAPDMADTLQTPAEAMLAGRDPSLLRQWIPLGRFGRPLDYANVALFLASEQSAFVTGHTIPVDGGTMAASGWYGKTGSDTWTNLPDRP